MNEALKRKIEIIHGNLFNLVDELNSVSGFVNSIGDISEGFKGNAGEVDLKTIFNDIRDKIKSASFEIEDNVKGLRMVALE